MTKSLLDRNFRIEYRNVFEPLTPSVPRSHHGVHPYHSLSQRLTQSEGRGGQDRRDLTGTSGGTQGTSSHDHP